MTERSDITVARRSGQRQTARKHRSPAIRVIAPLCNFTLRRSRRRVSDLPEPIRRQHGAVSAG